MLKGINLTLLIGPAVPMPAPKAVVDALTSVQVTNGKDRGGFQLMFTVDRQSSVLTTLLPAGYFEPVVTRVIIIVTLNGLPNVLMDGFVTNQELAPSNQPGQSHFTITGEDISLAMDRIELIRPFPGFTEIAMLYTVLAPYAAFGVVPVVIPPIIPTTSTPLDQWDTQCETDREFLQRLARRCGYTFCIQPGPLPGQSIAYFGPDTSLPVPQPALSVNLDGQSNVESLSFSRDGLAKRIGIYTTLDPLVKKIAFPVPVPNVNLFKPPLGAIPPIPKRVEYIELAADTKPDKVLQKVLGDLMSAPLEVSANGSLDVLRYQHILRARMLVGVRGAGYAYDGMYYVDSVTHSLKRGEYKQNFTLSRDGMITNTPRVLVS